MEDNMKSFFMKSFFSKSFFNKIFLEDCIMQKGLPACAGSPILKGFLSPLDATVVEKLNQWALPVAGRISMEEFGICDLFSHLPEQTSPAVAVVGSDPSHMALCNDIFGKIPRQASQNGLSYLQPTYGTVSRFGLIPTASSMDQIGILCADPPTGFSLLSKISGKDERDGAMYPEKTYHITPYKGKLRLAIPHHLWTGSPAGDWGAKERQELYSFLEDRFETRHTTLPYYELYKQVLYILSCGEICNNTNRYDGIKFGHRSKDDKGINDLYVNTRSEAFGLPAKLAILMGAMVLSKEHYEAYYEKAMKIRRLIKESLPFQDGNLLALPARCQGTPYDQSALYALTALAGLPSLTIPLGGSSVQLIADVKREDILLRAWQTLTEKERMESPYEI